MEPLTDWIVQYGYVGLTALLMLGIVGLPVPDETLLVFSGFLVHEGKLRVLPTFLAALAGAVSGITTSYLLGRVLGRPVVERYGRFIHLTEARLARVEAWFERYGEWVLPAGYFIPGVRHFSALAVGIAGLPYRRFALFAYTGACFWVALFLTLGFLVGDHWQAVMGMVHRYTGVAIAVAAVLIVGVIVVGTRSDKAR